MANIINNFKLYKPNGTDLFEDSNALSLNAITSGEVDVVESILPVESLYYANDVITLTLTITNHNTEDAITGAVVKNTFDTTLFKDLYYGVNVAPVSTNVITGGNLEVTVDIPVATSSTVGSETKINVHAVIA